MPEELQQRRDSVVRTIFAGGGTEDRAVEPTRRGASKLSLQFGILLRCHRRKDVWHSCYVHCGHFDAECAPVEQLAKRVFCVILYH